MKQPREHNRYVVRFRRVNRSVEVQGEVFDPCTDIVVFAYTQREAIMQAKYEAGRRKIPILECKVEVL